MKRRPGRHVRRQGKAGELQPRLHSQIFGFLIQLIPLQTSTRYLRPVAATKSGPQSASH